MMPGLAKSVSDRKAKLNMESNVDATMSLGPTTPIPLVNLIVALFAVHASDPWNVKELSAVYLAVYVSLAFIGTGQFSHDHLLSKHQPNLGKEDIAPTN
jgi:hypothetical protein